MNTFSDLFVSYRRDVSPVAGQYLNGLMQGGTRKNMERMEEAVPDSDHQSLHQFISNSTWDSQSVMDRVAEEADSIFENKSDSCLLIDESSFVKKGDKSVGVARQWLGCLGKVDNGQVGVFGSLCNGEHNVLIDGRLYLPIEWVDDKERCLKAKVPEEKIVFKTKDEIALEVVAHARDLGLSFGWVGADAGYGKGLSFCLDLEASKETFVVDIHSNQQIFEEEPVPYLPRATGKGRKPTLYKTDEKSMRVDKWALAQPASAWQRKTLRVGTKGTVTYEYLSKQVWVWKKGSDEVRLWHLIVRRDPESCSDYKYSFSNAPKNTSLKRLAFMQGQRYWIERSFEDGKNECGMADYQVRGWVGWHHHMALVMLAMLFMMEERIHNKKEHPLLSCSDIEILLSHFLPRRDTTKPEVIRQMKERHRRRQAAMESAAREKVKKRKKVPG